MLETLLKILIFLSIVICGFGFFSVFIVPENHTITSMFYVGLISWNLLEWISEKIKITIDENRNKGHN